MAVRELLMSTALHASAAAEKRRLARAAAELEAAARAATAEEESQLHAMVAKLSLDAATAASARDLALAQLEECRETFAAGQEAFRAALAAREEVCDSLQKRVDEAEAASASALASQAVLAEAAARADSSAAASQSALEAATARADALDAELAALRTRLANTEASLAEAAARWAREGAQSTADRLASSALAASLTETLVETRGAASELGFELAASDVLQEQLKACIAAFLGCKDEGSRSILTGMQHLGLRAVLKQQLRDGRMALLAS